MNIDKELHYPIRYIQRYNLITDNIILTSNNNFSKNYDFNLKNL